MILITGATGTNGKEIVNQLASRGAAFRSMVRDPAKVQPLPGMEVVRGDFDQPETLAAALQGVTTALLLSNPDPRQVERNTHFIDAARLAGVERIVRYSALGASPNSSARLLRWHGQGERYLESSGLAFTHIRPSFFMQNLLYTAGTIKSQGAIYQSAGDGVAGFVDVRDIAAAIVHTLTTPGHEGKTYELTGPMALNYRQIATILAGVLHRPVSYVDLPPAAVRQGMIQAGVLEFLADGILELQLLQREGKTATITDYVPRLTGRPAGTMEQFAMDYQHAFL